MRKRRLAMVRHSPQEIADFFGVYVAQDNEGKQWNLFADKPQQIGVCWYAELEDGGVDYGMDITDFINASANHDWHILYEPVSKAPHQSEVYTHKVYILIDASNPQALMEEVTKKLNEGWNLYGSPSIGADNYEWNYCQAMVRGL